MFSNLFTIIILLFVIRFSQALNFIKCSCRCPMDIRNLFYFQDIMLFDEINSKRLIIDNRTSYQVDQNGHKPNKTSLYYFLSLNVTAEEECTCRQQIVKQLAITNRSIDYCSFCTCNYDKKLKDEKNLIKNHKTVNLNVTSKTIKGKSGRKTRAATARPERLWEYAGNFFYLFALQNDSKFNYFAIFYFH